MSASPSCPGSGLGQNDPLPHLRSNRVEIHKGKRLRGTGVHAGRHIELVAAVAFDRDVLVAVAGDDTEGARHHAGPAADAPFFFPTDVALIVPVETAGDAGVDAGRVL